MFSIRCHELVLARHYYNPLHVIIHFLSPFKSSLISLSDNIAFVVHALARTGRLNNCLRFEVGYLSQIASSGANGSNRIRSNSPDINQEVFNSPARLVLDLRRLLAVGIHRFFPIPHLCCRLFQECIRVLPLAEAPEASLVIL